MFYLYIGYTSSKSYTLASSPLSVNYQAVKGHILLFSGTSYITVQAKLYEKHWMSRFRGGEGAGPRCRHGQESEVKGLFLKLKGFISRNKNHSNAGEKLETRKCTRGITKLETWKHEELDSRINKDVNDGSDGEDLTKTERKTGD